MVKGNVSEILKGILLIISAMMCFSIMDVMTKFLIDTYNPYQIVFVRSVLCISLCLGYAYFTAGWDSFKSQAYGLQFLRAFFNFTSMVAAILAIANMPLGEAVTIIYAAPILVSVLAIPVLGERIGMMRILAVLVGFAGVVIVVRPGNDIMHGGSIYALLSLVLYACMVMTTRKLGQRDRTVTTMFYSQMGFLVAGGGLALPNWVQPDMTGWGLLLIAGVAGAFGQLFMIRSYQLAPAGILSPFDYTAILWALAFGFFIFDEIPDFVTVIGVVLIIGAGWFIIYRETRNNISYDEQVSTRL